METLIWIVIIAIVFLLAHLIDLRILKLKKQREFVFFHEDKAYFMKDARILLSYRYEYGIVSSSAIYLVRFEDDEKYLYFRIEFDSSTDREPIHKDISLDEMRKELQRNVYRNPKKVFSSLNNDCIIHI